MGARRGTETKGEGATMRQPRGSGLVGVRPMGDGIEVRFKFSALVTR